MPGSGPIQKTLVSIGGKPMSTSICPCGSGNLLDACCGHYHAGHPAPGAEPLMRSRYSAYVLGLIDYLVDTTMPVQQAGLDRLAIADWSARSTWLGLEVEQSEVFGGQPEHAFVTFTARWHDAQGEHSHRERSSFVQNAGHWYLQHEMAEPSLVAAARWMAQSAPLPQGELAQLQQSLTRAEAPLVRYRCAACGFETRQYFWQCPGCQSWESYPPRRIEEL